MSEPIKSFSSPVLRILVVFVVALVILAMATDRLISSSEDKEFRGHFSQIVIGIPESMVLSLLGTPDNRSAEFYLGQHEGFEDAYKRAAESGVSKYLMWHRGSDSVYAVGIDAQGNAAVVEAGEK